MFEKFYRETMAKTEAWAGKRKVLRGTTTEVIDEIPDGALDFAYVDGDHTLRGITIDLVRVLGKVRQGGWIGGDDFCALDLAARRGVRADARVPAGRLLRRGDRRPHLRAAATSSS